MSDHLDVVARIKSELEARGQKWETNCDAAQITFRVAWELRGEGARLIEVSEAANHCLWEGRFYSFDKIAFPDVWVDILGSAGPPKNSNNPQWDTNVTKGPNTLWPPFDLDAHTEPPPPPVDQPPPAGTNYLGSLALELTGAANAAHDLGGALERAAKLLVEATVTAP
jgi:hypothetical protein